MACAKWPLFSVVLTFPGLTIKKTTANILILLIHQIIRLVTMETINVIPLPGAQFLNCLSWLKFNRNILCKILHLSEKLIMNVKSRIYSFTMNLQKKSVVHVKTTH